MTLKHVCKVLRISIVAFSFPIFFFFDTFNIPYEDLASWERLCKMVTAYVLKSNTDYGWCKVRLEGMQKRKYGNIIYFIGIIISTFNDMTRIDYGQNHGVSIHQIYTYV